LIRLLNEWDRAIILDYLSRNEDEVAFVFGNIQHCGITNRRDVLRCGDYYGYFEGDSLRGILVFYNLGTCIPHYESVGAIPFFSELMIKGRFNVLLGKDQIIRPLFEVVKNYKELKEFEECSYQINRNFKPFKLEGAVFVDVSGNDDTSVISFVRKAYWRGFGAERTIEGTRLLLLQKNAEEEFIILSVDNKLVAQACVQTFTDYTNQIGAVYSLEEERGKGYAKAAVSELCERIIRRGKLPTLIVSKKNIPALNAYKALGFEHYSDYLIIKFFI
jgi:GNAT superfamily N-acetyltransferase